MVAALLGSPGMLGPASRAWWLAYLGERHRLRREAVAALAARLRGGPLPPLPFWLGYLDPGGEIRRAHAEIATRLLQRDAEDAPPRHSRQPGAAGGGPRGSRGSRGPWVRYLADRKALGPLRKHGRPRPGLLFQGLARPGRKESQYAR
jgi:hypothetical protein